MRRPLPLLCLAFALSACGSFSDVGSPTSTATATQATASATARPVIHHARRRVRPKRHSAPSPSGLTYSTASAHRVQPQPAPGSCHATGNAPYNLPDRRCTPGALNPAVTHGTIGRTICVSGYTKTIRPPESITEPEKLASMAAYGFGNRPPEDFEYDHLVSLELGGAPNDPRNLWPEPSGSPNPKDSVENELHRLVCDGQMPLAQAQHIIATGWVNYAKSHGGAGTSPGAPRPAPGTTPLATPPPSSGGPNKPISEINCSDFSTHAAAQQWFTAHGGSASNDVAGLDGNHNGVACEALP